MHGPPLSLVIAGAGMHVRPLSLVIAGDGMHVPPAIPSDSGRKQKLLHLLLGIAQEETFLSPIITSDIGEGTAGTKKYI